MRPHGSPKALERRRRHAIALLEAGHPPVEVAARLGVRRRSVRRWKAAYREEGHAGIAAKPASGRPPKLDEAARETLREALLAGAEAAGFPTDLWTCRRVAELIRQRFAVRYHPSHVARLLRGMGWSPQRPSRRAIERDEPRIAAWVNEQWPRIKKGRPREGRGWCSWTKRAS